ncbi:FAD/NAD(P)-binding domain-containing protein [Penicillium samsonianum]|uniref:FAD/NAD(P)-binding domain-containing protein n=1 Tax=Penicillium samsonianum TaxID=1882272 RepID=UPI0025477C86|nr:FAD/NAD(P)-binding domain-containing protein [Penicillium samsonianum]KAJ6118419.1 FAD/NAD(P)-binding domain-containing protein [Penicillium samsonianum]
MVNLMSAAQLLPASYPAATSYIPSNMRELVETWVSAFNLLLRNADYGSLESLFFDESYWRDHLFLSWEFRAVRGPQGIRDFLDEHMLRTRLKGFEVSGAPKYTNIDNNGMVGGIEAVTKVASNIGHGQGVIRLMQDDQTKEWKCFTLFTTLRRLQGYQSPIENEADLNQPPTMSHESHNPACIKKIGAGHTGLMISARLKRIGILSLIVERNRRVGDNWRNRYHRLLLHDPVWYNTMPFLPFPDDWPTFSSKDEFGDWLEFYASEIELNVWNSAAVKSAIWKGTGWQVVVERKFPDGRQELCTMYPRHIIQATGLASEARVSEVPGMGLFEGHLCHSSQFDRATPPGSGGGHAVIVGSCSSAHDIAVDFYEKGYYVTMVQRSSTCVDPSDYSKGKGLYTADGPPAEEADLLTQSVPTAVLKRKEMELTQKLRDRHAGVFTGLEKRGFALNWGPGSSGRKLMFLETGGGYYIDSGASQHIIDGNIAVKQGSEPVRIYDKGLVLADGTDLAADVVIFATGYESMSKTTRKIFGDLVADRSNALWGLTQEGELKSVWRRSGLPGFWVAAGNIALSRYYSALLALQIQAIEQCIMQYGDN